jgi:cytochrome c oxidase subunit 3
MSGSPSVSTSELAERVPSPGGPPKDRNGRGQGGDDGWRDEDPEPEPEPRPPLSNAHFAVVLTIIASTMMFAGLIGGLIVLKSASKQWPPEGTPELPQLLWGSTALILVSSATLVGAQISLRRRRLSVFRWLLTSSLLLGLGFLVTQVICWLRLSGDGFLPATNNYGGKFYLLTWAHALHALLGAFFLAVVTWRSFAGKYAANRHTGVDLCAMFWHFVGLVWMVLFVLLQP